MFNLRKTLLGASLLISSFTMGQVVPEHPMYVDFGDVHHHDLPALIENWKPGDHLGGEQYEDENFFISRIPLKQRFENEKYRPFDVNPDRKLCWWVPMGESTKQWKQIPRYNFQCDNFSMWQYVDIHGSWGNGWFRVPGAFNDVAHKNGVRTGCLYFVNWAADVSENSDEGKCLAGLCAKNADGSFKLARKLVQFLKYYGIDGIGLNPEGYFSQTLTDNFSAFLAECHKMGEELNWPFHVEWYSMVSNSGQLSRSGYTLSGQNDKWFQQDGTPVTDVFFLDYGWREDGLKKACDYAESLGRSRYDIYGGMHLFKEEYEYKWRYIFDNNASVCEWGEHAESNLYSGSGETAADDLGFQNEYQKKQEMTFTNGKRNALAQMPLPSGYKKIESTFDYLKDFFGYSKAFVAKSTLTELPFVTRFNLGNGLSFREKGKVTFNHKWYNIGMQDLLPTWRWWIDNGDGKTIPTDPIQCDFNFEDAWFGGSCVKIHGATTRSDVRLFQSKFNITSTTDKFSITFKANQADPKLKLMVAKKGAETAFNYVSLASDAIVAGEWKTVTLDASSFNLSAGDVVTCMGLSFENTDANYEVLIGEMSLIPSNFNKTPVTPVLTKVKALKRTYKGVDFKVIFDVPFTGDRKVAYEGCPIYNEEVNTAYFEILFKQGTSAPRLVTCTTSWAAYAVDVPLYDIQNENFEIGVRAVGLDGKTKSPIVWSESTTTEVTVFEGLTTNKSVIKPNETFSVHFVDPFHKAASFKIMDAAGTTVATTTADANHIEASLAEVGVYDVEVTCDGTTSISRGMIDVTPESVGRMPKINSITADKTDLKKGETVNLTADFDKGVIYNTKSCKVSQGLYLSGGNQLKINSSIINSPKACSYAMWFRPDAFKSEPNGIMLMAKVNRDHPGSWTKSVWGEMGIYIRPSDFESTGSAANAISATFDYPVGGTPNCDHNTTYDTFAKDYGLQKDKWYHVCVVRDQNKAKIYVNGKLKSENDIRFSNTWSNTNVCIGGNCQSTGYFVGCVDEVQIWNKSLTDAEVEKTMKGYRIAPSGLQGYFKFEKTETDESGNTYFPNKGKNAMGVKGAYLTKCNSGSKDESILNEVKLGAGVPFITGSLNVEYKTAKWLLEGATHTQGEDGNAVATYQEAGNHPVTLTVTNTWGSTTKTLKEYIIVSDGGDGIEENRADNYAIYPNPFKETANVLFAHAGDYTVKVFDAQGRMVTAQEVSTEDNGVFQLSFNAPVGLYYVIVMKEQQCVRSFKVIKE